VSFDFRQIVGPEDSKQDNFSALCSQLIIRLDSKAKPVDGKGGDEGLDTFIGVFNGQCQAFQHKYFPDRVGKSQRKQIERSLNTALGKHKIKSWTLMLPINLNPDELRWFKALQAKHRLVVMDWWGKDKLCELLATHRDILREFTPAKPIQIIVLGSQAVGANVTEAQLAKALQKNLHITSSNVNTMDSILAAARDIADRTHLRILLWGPSDLSVSVGKKRLEIRDSLRALGHDAHLGEDLWTAELKACGLNLSVVELLQAQEFDYILVLMDSVGAVGEVHDFARIRSLASKMMICVDHEHQKGYCAQGVLRIFEGHNGKLDWFIKPDDIDQCNLATRVLSQIAKVAEAKQSILALGGSFA
jgi:hypothetical protein